MTLFHSVDHRAEPLSNFPHNHIPPRSRLSGHIESENSADMENHKCTPLPVVWGDLTEKNVSQLQRLNATIFPVKYNDLFYQEAIKAPEGFVKLVYYNDLLVGAVCCRRERQLTSNQAENDSSFSSSSSEKSSLYILTLGVLAPYRERGIGKKLLSHVLNLVETSPHCKDVSEVYLHVQDGNDDALRFYRSQGFEVTEKLVGYYKRIEPADCFIVRKTIKHP